MLAMPLPNWSSLAWRGFASLLFGILALAWPGITLAALTLMWGAFAFVDGVLALVVAAQRGPRPHRALLVFDGLFGVAAGAVALLWPGITLLALVVVIGVRSMLMGGFQLAAAMKLRNVVGARVLYAFGGVCSILLAIAAFVMPGVTALVLVTMLAVYALVFGVVLIVLSLRIRRTTYRGGSLAAAT
jgi:uncharacterized membrane protein HdeD (DUF308 family)